jgi:hypothetical protein
MPDQPKVGDRARVQFMGHWFTGRVVRLASFGWYDVTIEAEGMLPVTIPRGPNAQIPSERGGWEDKPSCLSH